MTLAKEILSEDSKRMKDLRNRQKVLRKRRKKLRTAKGK
jgi:hypothetical protein